MKKQFLINYKDIVCLDSLLFAWQNFLVGKKSKKDVQEFSLNLMDNLFQLHHDLTHNNYQHGGYTDFFITDPKLRHIHKASVRDRLVHHMVYQFLYPFFDKTFMAGSYSCRINKGSHKAVSRFRTFIYQASQNSKYTCWVLKCDIKKFFDSIDQKILIEILESYISDYNILNLLKEIIKSYSVRPGKGLPLGNLTSQLFVNIYMNEFDQFIKHKLKVKYYIRYADDFVILSDNREELFKNLYHLESFLNNKLKLEMHPHKIFMQTAASGVDFLGWINFNNHRVLRTKTKKRMFKRIKEHTSTETLNSYLGLLKHGDTYILQQELLNSYWFWK